MINISDVVPMTNEEVDKWLEIHSLIPSACPYALVAAIARIKQYTREPCDLERWDCKIYNEDWGPAGGEIKRNPSGAWVKYDDAVAIISRLTAGRSAA